MNSLNLLHFILLLVWFEIYKSPTNSNVPSLLINKLHSNDFVLEFERKTKDKVPVCLNALAEFDLMGSHRG